MKVTAVLPAFNAEKTIHKTYAAIPKAAIQEIILVDDASTDNTVAAARAIPDMVVFVHEKNKGYGGNQKTCYTKALERQADIVVMIHPDFQYDPCHVPAMVAPIASGSADMVLGSRLLGADPRAQGMDWWRYLGNRFLTTMQNWVLNIKIHDGHSGYRAYSRRLLESIPFTQFSDNFSFDAQMIAAVARASLKIAEVPIPTRYTSDSSSISFKSSINYGFATLFSLLPIFLNNRKTMARHKPGFTPKTFT